MSLSIRHKAVLPVGILSLIVTLLGGLGYLTLNTTAEITEDLATRFQEIEEVRNIEVAVSHLVYPHLSYISKHNKNSLNSIKDIFDTLDKQITELSEMDAINDDEREFIESVTQRIVEIKLLSQQIIAVPIDRQMQAMALIQTLSENHLAVLSKELQAYHVSELRQVYKLRDQAHRHMDEFNYWAIGLTVFTLSMLLFTYWLHNNTLVKPILSLSLSTHGLATGDLKQAATIHSDDEIGKLAQDINTMAASLDKLYSQLNKMALTDQLTGLANRHAYEGIVEQQISAAHRYNRTLAIALVDIDFFKNVNDSYGHNIGDQVLIHVANLLRSELRDCDFCFRFGGEEFVLLLPQLNAEQLMSPLERCRNVVANQPYIHEGKEISLTISIGVACYPMDAMNAGHLLKKADAALYHSKNSGRNRATCSSELEIKNSA